MLENEAPQRQHGADESAALNDRLPRTTAATLASLSVVLTACGGGSGGEAGSGNPPPAGDAVQGDATGSATGSRYTAAASDADAARFLQQVQFASSLSDIQAVRSSPYAAWLQQQFAQPQGPTGWDWLNAQGYGDASNSAAYYNQSSPADYMIWRQLLGTEDPVRRRLALALSEYFVVSITMMEVQWRSHVMAHYWDTLVGHAFGNFRNLLEAVTLNPAMGYFLNTRGNQKENNKGRVPDENYAREVMQLFTIGLYQLNLDGSIKTDGSGQPLDSYTQEDVTNLARVFTGYDIDYANDARVPTSNPINTIYPPGFARRPMKLDANKHSTLPVQFLGHSVPNTDGKVALQGALDVLFNHPNVGPFFGRQMIQRLVTSNPSPDYVARVAAAFNDNGSGVRGDLRAVWAAVLLDDEARDPAGVSDPLHGKLREPMLRFIQWAQSFGAASKADTWRLGDLSNASSQLGQSPLRSPSVFNFFRPGYVPPSTDLASQQSVAPEFQLVNETSVGGYLNFMQSVIFYGLLSGDIKASYATELSLVGDPVALVDHVSLVLCAGQVPPAQKALMVEKLKVMVYEVNATSISTADKQLSQVAAVALMVMATSAYLVQK